MRTRAHSHVVERLRFMRCTLPPQPRELTAEFAHRVEPREVAPLAAVSGLGG